MSSITRRDWLKTTAAGTALAAGWGEFAWGQESQRKKLPIAAIVTDYHRNTHPDVIVSKVLEGYDQQGGPGPDLELVSIYTDQVHANDLSRGMAEKHGFRLCQTIEEAITLGTEKVQVAGVLSIGEHGDYPKTEDTGQKMYPRRRFFDAITEAFKKAGSVVPVFNDKHLAYKFSDAKHMYDTAKEMKIPFMAGSSIPVAWRRPPLTLPKDCEIEAAISVGYGGAESYGFHALEGLQCMIERRKGGESGVKSVQAVSGDDIWKAEADGRWHETLLEAALATTPYKYKGTIKEKLSPKSSFYLFEHNDGLKSCVAMAGGVARQFCFAAKLKGRDEPVATFFELEEEAPYGHFGFLLKAIDEMIHTGQPAYPVERTLLTTGMLDYVMHSMAEDGKQYDTPDLKIAYQGVEWPFANEQEG